MFHNHSPLLFLVELSLNFFVDLGKFSLIFSAIIVTDRETRKSRGFGYVTFTNEVDAKEAMSSMAGERGKVPVIDHVQLQW